MTDRWHKITHCVHSIRSKVITTIKSTWNWRYILYIHPYLAMMILFFQLYYAYSIIYYFPRVPGWLGCLVPGGKMTFSSPTVSTLAIDPTINPYNQGTYFLPNAVYTWYLTFLGLLDDWNHLNQKAVVCAPPLTTLLALYIDPVYLSPSWDSLSAIVYVLHLIPPPHDLPISQDRWSW